MQLIMIPLVVKPEENVDAEKPSVDATRDVAAHAAAEDAAKL